MNHSSIHAIRQRTHRHSVGNTIGVCLMSSIIGTELYSHFVGFNSEERSYRIEKYLETAFAMYILYIVCKVSQEALLTYRRSFYPINQPSHVEEGLAIHPTISP